MRRGICDIYRASALTYEARYRPYKYVLQHLYRASAPTYVEPTLVRLPELVLHVCSGIWRRRRLVYGPTKPNLQQLLTKPGAAN